MTTLGSAATLPSDHTATTRAHSAEIGTAAAVAGGALLAMIVIAPLGILLALPRGLAGVTALSVVVIAVLDVIAAVALVPVLTDGGRLLTLVAAALRICYAAGFAAAATHLVGNVDAAQFTAAWDLVLFVFGAHLVGAGVAAVRSRRVPTWIGVMVVLAGVAYLLDATLATLPVATPVTLASFAFVGEVALCGWLLVLAVRGRRRGE